ncbi:hypothetical protein GCM10027443_18140 [Pontibacter brevis]
MDKQNPFSLYDFLGYLIPGGLLIYAYLTIRYIDSTKEFNVDLFIETFSRVKLEGVFVFIIAAYSLGHLLSFVSSITVEMYANWQYDYPSKYLLGHKNKNYWQDFDRKNWKQNFWRVALIIILLPCVVLDYLLGQFFEFRNFYQKPLDSSLRNAVNIKVVALIKKLSLVGEEGLNKSDYEKHDFHRIVTHYTFENSKQHQFRMVNYVALYGFLRNFSFIFIILSWYWLYQLIYVQGLNFRHEFSVSKLLILITLMAISYIAFMAFMKFYRRYTLEGFMLLVVDENLK